MGLAIGGIIANWFAVLIFYLNSSLNRDEASQIVLPFAIIFALIATLGLIVATNNKKIGGILIIIGSIFFIPLGLIGVFGGKKVVSQENAKSLDERRNF
ncbi:hypothetical protein GQ597_03510 [Gilliamella sp. Pra-s65]|uniref:hypothetical protein n=1 Tax=unclassified Gilliamella TaxID=2685620 RepID=UPI00132834C9|nr:MULTISPECIES: hypothetical protein [unclassified Gilliamella]MWN30949.1 hypothetical protein [Gilliamella sp. Pra-s60]MWN89778.1 hypothetical protein [Gilliamella sp. Pra-s65]MWP28486.1 hypothetical protein [Gilliamella sp. Pra-s54]MWP46918.1 hypothetical protein [Gilliamella sp. Pas-s27]MWP72950.1 hypothetical protein [Gilliamella sp. Pra-s52]